MICKSRLRVFFIQVCVWRSCLDDSSSYCTAVTEDTVNCASTRAPTWTVCLRTVLLVYSTTSVYHNILINECFKEQLIHDCDFLSVVHFVFFILFYLKVDLTCANTTHSQNWKNKYQNGTSIFGSKRKKLHITYYQLHCLYL